MRYIEACCSCSHRIARLSVYARASVASAVIDKRLAFTESKVREEKNRGKIDGERATEEKQQQ